MADNKNGVKKFGEQFSELLSKTKENVSKLVDQNDDGNFDSKDVSLVFNRLKDTAKNTYDTVKTNLDQNQQDRDLKNLRPIFESTLSDTDFFVSKLVRITTIDKKHAESKVCQNAIGHIDTYGGLEVINIYRDKAKYFGLTFFPNNDAELYYVDPTDHERYIELDNYFSQLKNERISELERIAFDLGAKHCKVLYKEQTISSSKVNVNHKSKLNIHKSGANSDIDINVSADKFCSVEIAAQSDFIGHKPQEPVLRYLKHEPHILNLIDLRMNEAPITHKKMEIKLIESSGIKTNDAVKIDAAIKAMRFESRTSIVAEVNQESQRSFEYEIDF